jgi:hypothetical protein
MSRCAFLAAALVVLLLAGPCFAVDTKQKMATCKFGADQQRRKARRAMLSSRNAWRIGTPLLAAVDCRAIGRLLHRDGLRWAEIELRLFRG